MELINRITRTVLTGGVEEASYRRIKGNIQESNRRTVLVFSTIVVFGLLALSVAAFMVQTMQPYRPVYISGLLVCATILCVAKFLGDKYEAAVNIDMYAFAFFLICVGIAMGTVMSPNELAATYIALLLAVPQLFIDRPWRVHVLILISVVLFILVAVKFKNPVTIGSDIVNAIVFGILSVALSTFAIQNRIKRFALEEEIRFLAENDQLTGLKNRYCYQQYLDGADILKSSSIYCVYVDANGLHELNDREGHEAGDKMLQYIATVMQNLFGRDNTYRIGGDEFVAIGIDRTCDEIAGLADELKRAAESAGYHVAVGIGLKEKIEINLNSIIKKAEKEMYKDKAEYYQNSGKDRRNRT